MSYLPKNNSYLVVHLICFIFTILKEILNTNLKKTSLFLHQIETLRCNDHGLKGAWGVYLVLCNGGKSWKRTDTDRAPFFLLVTDITEVLEHYNFEDDGRTIRYNFPNVVLEKNKKSST
jgi:hypothetical protein